MFTRKHRIFLSSSGETNIYPYLEHNDQIYPSYLVMFEANVTFSHDLHITLLVIMACCLARPYSSFGKWCYFCSSRLLSSLHHPKISPQHQIMGQAVDLHSHVLPPAFKIFLYCYDSWQSFAHGCTINNNSPKTP